MKISEVVVLANNGGSRSFNIHHHLAEFSVPTRPEQLGDARLWRRSWSLNSGEGSNGVHADDLEFGVAAGEALTPLWLLGETAAARLCNDRIELSAETEQVAEQTNAAFKGQGRKRNLPALTRLPNNEIGPGASFGEEHLVELRGLR